MSTLDFPLPCCHLVGWTKYFSRGVQPAGTSFCCIPKEQQLTTWHQDENVLACSDTLPMKYLAFAIALRLFARSFNTSRKTARMHLCVICYPVAKYVTGSHWFPDSCKHLQPSYMLHPMWIYLHYLHRMTIPGDHSNWESRCSNQWKHQPVALHWNDRHQSF